MLKSKIEKKGCQNWGKAVNPKAQTACQKAKSRKKDAGTGGKAVNPQAQTACQKAKSRKKDAGAEKKSSHPKHKRHAKKQNREKGMPEPGKSHHTTSTNGMQKSKIEKKGCRSREKADTHQA